jgi:hypothetical protein
MSFKGYGRECCSLLLSVRPKLNGPNHRVAGHAVNSVPRGYILQHEECVKLNPRDLDVALPQD